MFSDIKNEKSVSSFQIDPDAVPFARRFQRSVLNEFNEMDVSRIVGHFHTPSVIVSPAFAIDLNAAVEHFNV